MATLSLALAAQLACLWEATARKVGNVHRYHDFADTTWLDFAMSSASLAEVMAQADSLSLGQLVLRSIEARQRVTKVNTNLGIVLLLAPLAKGRSRAGVRQLLAEATVSDSELVCEAIRLARPAGLGKVDEGDVAEPPQLRLRELMRLAADRDLIARQYANDFEQVYEVGVVAIEEGIRWTGCLEGGIVLAQLKLMSEYPDSLIARKGGIALAEQAATQAKQVLAQGWPHSEQGRDALRQLDGWLREQGNLRNPGTTADLLAASLFVLLMEGRLAMPLVMAWSRQELGL
jgi:triphosphoribosyl-dephospho-CoA synthase